jgi:very-short-patch-repair endonuclease
MGVLNGEIARKRGHMPLRRLFKMAGHAVQAIKPVFMMSPLSVAQFLEPGALEFDMLVIDEASQIEPVDALGAVARCKQLVVVGDDRQLPPTRFFSRMTTEIVADEESDDEAFVAGASDVESILSLCVAKGMPQTMLRWHYRSRHQSLIAVSNQQFYKSGLFIVPSPYTATAGIGLRFNHVPTGVFESGGARVNREEAKVIARAIMSHAKTTPQLSLGVAAFSLQQKIAIQDELELLRREHPEAEAFFTEHPTEPFFIKNLENVQGDERDVIFISVAYARNASGYLPMKFGPVSRDGGERRLNVLISRAKLRCEVFSSITSDDIDLERGKGKGVVALKVFLGYAETGRLSLASRTDRELDSPFELEVKQALEAKGFTVHPQIGIAGFFIDLAILDDDQTGRYLLGIECDGITYHSSRSARDRDRLRQAVLEDHGWILHRVWSCDWFRQPQVEIQKIIAAAEAAKAELTARQEREIPLSPGGSLQINFVDRESHTEVGIESVNTKINWYQEAQFAVPRNQELHEVPVTRLAEFLHQIVDAEGPVHFDEAVTRLRTLWGLQRAGNRIRDILERAKKTLVADKRIVDSDSFLDIPGREIRIRNRSNVGSSTLRKPEYLPPSEISEAICAVLRDSFGGSRDEIPSAVAKAFGFGMLSGQLRDLLLNHLDLLQKRELVRLSGEIYRVA